MRYSNDWRRQEAHEEEASCLAHWHEWRGRRYDSARKLAAAILYDHVTVDGERSIEESYESLYGFDRLDFEEYSSKAVAQFLERHWDWAFLDCERELNALAAEIQEGRA